MSNFVKFNKENFRLTDKQKVLYLFIVDKVEKDEAITFDEAKNLYAKYSCHDLLEGEPARYAPYLVDGKCEIIKQDKYELRQNVVNYITRGIGSLVLKGALKITPQLQFN